MAKNTAPEEKAGEQKIVTRYDRRMEERRIQKEKDKKQEKMIKLIASIIGVVLVVILAISIVRPIAAKQAALKGTYIQVGSHNISRLEYDYYYNMMLNNNASILSYYGLDTSSDLSEYMISEDMSFRDMYDNMAVEQIQQVKAMVDEAQKNGFTYDGDAEYEEYMDSMKSFLEEQGMDIDEYYKEMYGTYATVSNITPFEMETMLANAYYQELIEQNRPSDEEITAYYEENKTDYDKIDYRSFTFTADLDTDASEEETAEAMEKIQADAQAMAEDRKAGEDFNELCLAYASEEAKENYEDPENDYSLAEGRYRSSITTVIADWLYDDARTQGDIEVLEDADNNRCYVVEFVNRYYDESDDDRIASLLSGEVVTEMIEELTEQSYQISDPKGNLHYLTISTGEETTEEQPAE